ncbi:CvpA family protein [Balneolaceae bacterium ANBcel3]|nr:CvpA family protein [Balneolaceae bacterium ANBcel3]
MILLDVILAGAIIYYTWKGFNNGLIKEVFRIAGLVIATFISFQYAEPFANMLRPIIRLNPDFYPYFAFAVLFILFIILVYFAIKFFDGLIQVLMLSIPNKILGAIFGFLKISLLLSVFLIFLGGFDKPSQETRHDSIFYKHVIKVAPASYDIVAKVLPGVKSYKDSVDEYISIPDFSFPELPFPSDD